MAKRTVAFESANSFVKVFSDGKGLVYPNTVSDVGLENFNQISKEEVYRYDGMAFTVGKTLNYETSSSQSLSRYGSDEYRRESVAAISKMVNDGDSVTVVTGIPSQHYNAKEDALRLLNLNLKKSHTIEVNGEEKTFTVTKVIVILQPLATFFYSIIDETGQTDDDMLARIEDTSTLIVDIGWGTTDVAVLVGSTLKETRHIDTNMHTVYSHISETIKQKHKKLATMEIPLLELERQFRKGTALKWANKQYECRDIIEEVFEKASRRIVSQIGNMFKIEDYATVIFTGGGATALQANLSANLTDKTTGKIEDNIMLMHDSQMVIVKGYYVFAKYLL